MKFDYLLIICLILWCVSYWMKHREYMNQRNVIQFVFDILFIVAVMTIDCSGVQLPNYWWLIVIALIAPSLFYDIRKVVQQKQIVLLTKLMGENGWLVQKHLQVQML